MQLQKRIAVTGIGATNHLIAAAVLATLSAQNASSKSNTEAAHNFATLTTGRTFNPTEPISTDDSADEKSANDGHLPAGYANVYAAHSKTLTKLTAPVNGGHAPTGDQGDTPNGDGISAAPKAKDTAGIGFAAHLAKVAGSAIENGLNAFAACDVPKPGTSRSGWFGSRAVLH